MATKKKPAAKKTMAAKATAKAPLKVTKKVFKPKAKKATYKEDSFKLTKETIPFTSFKVTEQTLYWGILFLYIFALSLWVLSIQLNILDVIEQINASILV